MKFLTKDPCQKQKQREYKKPTHKSEHHLMDVPMGSEIPVPW